LRPNIKAKIMVKTKDSPIVSALVVTLVSLE